MNYEKKNFSIIANAFNSSVGMSRKALIILSLFMIFFSCNCENTKDYTNLEYTVIDVGSDIGKGRVVDFSEIASEITYIPLESKAEAFIGIAP